MALTDSDSIVKLWFSSCGRDYCSALVCLPIRSWWPSP